MAADDKSEDDLAMGLLVCKLQLLLDIQSDIHLFYLYCLLSSGIYNFGHKYNVF